MELTKSQKSTIRHLSSLKMVRVIIALFGIGGLLLGLYTTFFRYMSPDARPLNLVLTLFSVGLVSLGCLLKQAYGIIEQFSKDQQIE